MRACARARRGSLQPAPPAAPLQPIAYDKVHDDLEQLQHSIDSLQRRLMDGESYVAHPGSVAGVPADWFGAHDDDDDDDGDHVPLPSTPHRLRRPRPVSLRRPTLTWGVCGRV